MLEKISNATQKNWKRLNVDVSTKSKLQHGANKRMSTKQFIPIELFSNPDNVKFVKKLQSELLCKFNNKHKIMRSFCIKLLMQFKLLDETFDSMNKYVKEFAQENTDIYFELLKIELPMDEKDILGIIYQSIRTEGDKNETGSYYTPEDIAKDLCSRVLINEKSTVLDPCCGTGSFLLNVKAINPNNLYGIDIDKISVMICKTNLFIKYKEYDFKPNIFECDFLEKDVNLVLDMKFDYIITNPPWGSNLSKVYKDNYPEIISGESYSYFLINALRYIKNNGKIFFLLPESFLNVKVHKDIRSYLASNKQVNTIILYSKLFSEVLTKFIGLEVTNRKLDDYTIEILDNHQTYYDTKNNLLARDNCVIRPNSELDKKILKKIYEGKYSTLSNSIWGLGIVTGNNKEKLIQEKNVNEYEPIYTGKEVQAYKLMQCRYYIKYDRKKLQQVAPDYIYRAEEKLIYKFISKDLAFAYDNKQELVLNSANILIPKIDGMSIKTIMAFLNSNLFKYIYRQKFGEIKILKGNLCQLPFKEITEEKNNEIEYLVNEILFENKNNFNEINQKVYKLYKLNKLEIKRIEEVVNG